MILKSVFKEKQKMTIPLFIDSEIQFRLYLIHAQKEDIVYLILNFNKSISTLNSNQIIPFGFGLNLNTVTP